MTLVARSLDLFNRNAEWQQQCVQNGEQEQLLQLAFEITGELKQLQRIEKEAEVTRDYGLLMRLRRAGFLILTYDDFCKVTTALNFWKEDVAAVHRCRRVDVFTCSVCHAEDRMLGVLDAFLQHRLHMHRQNPAQQHLCTRESVRVTPGCTLFSFRPNERVALLSNPDEFIVATATWFICVETGRMHRCQGREQCSGIQMVREEGIALAYSCVISGYAKSAPISSWNSWDGVHFYSTGRLAQIRNEISNREVADMEGDEEGAGGEDDYDDVVEEVEERIEKVEPKPAKRLLDELKEEDSKRQKVEQEAEVEEVEEGEQPDSEIEEEPEELEDQQGFREFLGSKTNRDLATPVQSLQKRARSNNLTDLAFHLATERLADEQKERAKKAERDLIRSRQPVRLGFQSNNREMRSLISRVQPQLHALKEKGKTDEGTTIQKRKQLLRAYIELNAEEKTAQFLARGSEEIAVDIVWYVFGADAKNRIAQSRLPRGIEVANLAVNEMIQQYNTTHVARIGVWCEKLSEVVGCALLNPVLPIDSVRYCRIIMDHWSEVSQLPLVTEMLDVHKKKKRKPVDFVLYCLGVLYSMAEGGITVRVQLDGNIPPVLLNSSRGLRKVVLAGPKVVEFPDESAVLKEALLRADLIPSLTEVYPDGYQFDADSLTEARQVLRHCYEARHRQQQHRLYAAIEEWELQRARGEPTNLTIETIYLNYCRWLQPPHSAKHVLG